MINLITYKILKIYTCLFAKFNKTALLEASYWNFSANIKDHNFGIKTLTDFK